MKSILIIGMGAFGKHLALKMAELKNHVMIVDTDQAIVEEMSVKMTDSLIGDCTKEEVLKSIGVKNFDICFVTIGDNFQSSLEITSLLKELGATYVISKASRDIQEKFLLRNGADEVVCPDKDMAEKLAIRTSSDNIFDFIEITKDYSIYEIPIMTNWIGHSIAEVGVRKKYNINILTIKKDDIIMPVPKADYVFQENDLILVLGKSSDVIKLANQI